MVCYIHALWLCVCIIAGGLWQPAHSADSPWAVCKPVMCDIFHSIKSCDCFIMFHNETHAWYTYMISFACYHCSIK